MPRLSPRQRLYGPALAACLLTATAAWAEDRAEVAFHPEPGRLRITLGGEPLADYVFRDDAIPRPYFAHVHAPGGTPVTRNHPPVTGTDPTDHAALHPGLWMAFGDLSGADSWRNRAPIEHVEFVEPPRGGPGRGTFAVENLYRSASGHAILCREVCRATILARPAGTLLIVESKFASDAGDVAFGDQEEMGFGVRVATPLTVKNGGRILNSDGARDEGQVRGRAADWCDDSGTIGDRRAGVTLMPDPRNFHRSWYHARDYGLLVANPFGRKSLGKGPESRVVVKRGETFRLGFGILLHSAPAGREIDLAAAYRDYLEQIEPPGP
ncbi:MAG TPA: DUF6807 family protein [Isosphaeraceae bacterium]